MCFVFKDIDAKLELGFAMRLFFGAIGFETLARLPSSIFFGTLRELVPSIFSAHWDSNIAKFEVCSRTANPK